MSVNRLSTQSKALIQHLASFLDPASAARLARVCKSLCRDLPPEDRARVEGRWLGLRVNPQQPVTHQIRILYQQIADEIVRLAPPNAYPPEYAQNVDRYTKCLRLYDQVQQSHPLPDTVQPSSARAVRMNAQELFSLLDTQDFAKIETYINDSDLSTATYGLVLSTLGLWQAVPQTLIRRLLQKKIPLEYVETAIQIAITCGNTDTARSFLAMTRLPPRSYLNIYSNVMKHLYVFGRGEHTPSEFEIAFLCRLQELSPQLRGSYLVELAKLPAASVSLVAERLIDHGDISLKFRSLALTTAAKHGNASVIHRLLTTLGPDGDIALITKQRALLLLCQGYSSEKNIIEKRRLALAASYLLPHVPTETIEQAASILYKKGDSSELFNVVTNALPWYRALRFYLPVIL